MIGVGLGITAGTLSITTLFARITGLTGGLIDQTQWAFITARMSNGDPITSPRWGSTFGGTEFGTGASPTDLSGLAQGDVVHFEGLYNGETVRVQAVSYRPVTSAGTIEDQDLILGTGSVEIDLLTYFPHATSFAVSGAGASLDGTGTILRLSSAVALSGEIITVTGSNPLNSVSSTCILTVTGASISAVMTPATSPVWAGQTMADMASYAAMISETNFTSTAGTVRAQDVTVAFTGVAGASEIFEAGESVSFTVEVTDDQGTGPVTFTTSLQLVDDMYVIEATGPNFEITDLSELPSDSDALYPPLVIDGVTHPLTMGDLRAISAGVPAALRSEIIYTGTLAELVAGDVLTGESTVLYADAEPTLAHVWKRDGTAISGVTTSTHSIVSADLDTDISYLATPAGGAALESDAVAIPAPVPTGLQETLIETYTDAIVDGVDTSLHRIAFDFAGLTTGDAVVGAIFMRDALSEMTSLKLVSADASETACTIRQHPNGGRVNVLVFSTTVPADKIGNIEIQMSETSSLDAFAGVTYVVPGATGFAGSSNVVGGGNPVAANIDKVANGVLLSFAAEDRADGSIVITGMSTTNQQTIVPVGNAAYSLVSNAERITASAAGQTITGTMTGNGHAALAAIMVT